MLIEFDDLTDVTHGVGHLIPSHALKPAAIQQVRLISADTKT